MKLDAANFREACTKGGALLDRWLRAFDARHGPRLYREAAIALRDDDDAHDVVQDGMVKVWQRCALFVGDADPLAWIQQIVRNTLVDALRARRPHVPLYTEDGELTPQAQAALDALARQRHDSPQSLLESREVERVFRECFAAFERAAPDHAYILRLVAIEGLTNLEVARILDRTPAATREYISQCRKRARPFLQRWYRLVAPGGPAASPGDKP